MSDPELNGVERRMTSRCDCLQCQALRSERDALAIQVAEIDRDLAARNGLCPVLHHRPLTWLEYQLEQHEAERRRRAVEAQKRPSGVRTQRITSEWRR